MDWKNTTFDWNRARAAVVTAETGSLSAAARVLGLTQPTLGRQVTALEEELGISLFTRAGKRMELTEAGLRMVEHFRTMAEAAHAAARAASGQSQEIAGVVTITAAHLYATELLPPILAQIRKEAPRCASGDRLARHVRPHAAGGRYRHPPCAPDQPDLTAKLVSSTTPRSMRRRSFWRRVRSKRCLSSATISPIPMSVCSTRWELKRPARERRLPCRGQPRPARDGAHAGLGVVALPLWCGDPDPMLVRAQPGAPPLVRFPVWLAAHRDLHTSRRIRLVFDRSPRGWRSPTNKPPRRIRGGRCRNKLLAKNLRRPHIGSMAKNIVSPEWSSTPSLSVDTHIVPSSAIASPSTLSRM
jgi:DNA-binding transcriptional LysR family regulator